MKFVVRDADAKDAEFLDKMLTQLIREEAVYDENLNGAYTVENNYREWIGLEGHKILIAEAGGKAVGYLYGFVYQIPGMWNRPVAILDALFVEKNHRREGCASALVSEFQKFAAESGANRMELKVISENLPAYKLYSRMNFKEVKKYMSCEM